jgi:uncharacterized Rmd1/YagE family protein
MKFLNARKAAYHTSPKLIDQVIYSPYLYDPPFNGHRSTSTTAKPETRRLLDTQDSGSEDDTEVSRFRKKKNRFYSTHSESAEIFLFDYGTVVIWGMTEAQEKRFLTSMSVYLTSMPRHFSDHERLVQKAL